MQQCKMFHVKHSTKNYDTNRTKKLRRKKCYENIKKYSNIVDKYGKGVIM